MKPITFPLHGATTIYSTLFSPMPPEWLSGDLALYQLADGSTVRVGWSNGPRGRGFLVAHETLAATADDLSALLGRLAREAEERAMASGADHRAKPACQDGETVTTTESLNYEPA